MRKLVREQHVRIVVVKLVLGIRHKLQRLADTRRRQVRAIWPSRRVFILGHGKVHAENLLHNLLQHFACFRQFFVALQFQLTHLRLLVQIRLGPRQFRLKLRMQLLRVCLVVQYHRA